jgi:hypothetical protein
MQLCEFEGVSSYFAVRALDFIAGYPATEGKLTYNPYELVEDIEGNSKRWLGRGRCIGYTIAHAISIPISPLIALVRIVAMPIFFVTLIVKACNPEDRLEMSKYLFIEWLRECAGVITSPLWNIAGVVRAALGIIEPSLYLKAPYVSQLSESQRNQAAAFFHQRYSPSARN